MQLFWLGVMKHFQNNGAVGTGAQAARGHGDARPFVGAIAQPHCCHTLRSVFCAKMAAVVENVVKL